MKSSSILKLALAGSILASATAIHFDLNRQGWTVASPLASVDRLFDIALAILFALASIAVGRVVLRALRWHSDAWIESNVFAFGIGAGAWWFIWLAMGLAGLLYEPLVLAWFIGILIALQSEWRAFGCGGIRAWQTRSRLTRAESWLLLACGIIVLPVFLGALLPPTGADALAYHLVAPAQFLQKHFIFASYDNIGLNYPIGGDLLYVLPLAAGSDIAAQLIHFLFALATALSVYAFAAARFSRAVGLLAFAIFWTSGVVGLLAVAPVIDLAWTFYEVLALWAFIRWRETRNASDLVIVGIAAGLALSNKYLAVIGVGVIGALIVIESWRARRDVIDNALRFGLVVLIVAAPWYLKNWLWLANPVYPFFLGSYGFDGVMQTTAGNPEGWIGMGLGRDLYALLQFPFNVYAHWQFFGPNRGGPSFFFLLLPIYFLLPKRGELNLLLGVSGLRFTFWWLSTQNIRYLLPIFPWLSIVSAYIVAKLTVRIQRPVWRAMWVFVSSICLLVGIFLQWGFLLALNDGAIGFLTGNSSREQFLNANLWNYPATRFINTTLPDTATILMIGDFRRYYMRRNIITDESHDNWQVFASRGKTPAGIAAQMRAWGVTHVWISADDLTFFRNMWKIDAPADQDAELFTQFQTRYLEPMYADERGYAVYALRP